MPLDMGGNNIVYDHCFFDQQLSFGRLKLPFTIRFVEENGPESMGVPTSHNMLIVMTSRVWLIRLHAVLGSNALQAIPNESLL